MVVQLLDFIELQRYGKLIIIFLKEECYYLHIFKCVIQIDFWQMNHSKKVKEFLLAR